MVNSLKNGTISYSNDGSLIYQKSLNYLKSIIKTLPHFHCLNWEIESIQIQANRFKKFKDVIFLGTGGSSLGGQALVALQTTSQPKIHFIDNIDSQHFSQIVEKCYPETTGVIVISKSGNTVETLMQFLTLKKLWKDFSWNHQALIITEKKTSALTEISNKLSIPALDHPYDIGGRFSVFTLVGLLPMLVANLDLHDFRQGAQNTIDTLCNLDDGEKSPCIQGAVQTINLAQRGINQSIMFVYSNVLYVFAAWYAQLWGESLGKKNQQNQRFGTTPNRALGTVDQHSQLQLYLDGPRDKFFTIITVSQQYPLPFVNVEGLEHSVFSFFKDKSMADLMIAEQKATIETMKQKGCIVREMRIEKIDEFSLGGLMMHFILETLCVAYLWEINPFDQPAVEDGKKLALKFLKT